MAIKDLMDINFGCRLQIYPAVAVVKSVSRIPTKELDSLLVEHMAGRYDFHIAIDIKHPELTRRKMLEKEVELFRELLLAVGEHLGR